jgi:hypothetical protein
VLQVLKKSHCTYHPFFSKVWTLFLKKCVNLLQEVFYPGSSLLAGQGAAGKGINDLNSGTTHTRTSPANLNESILGGDDTLFYLHSTENV